ncbi:MAG: hypothetical protein RKR03_00490, partial [Candidatus Competibacter sp.]|nr:hypothetical protein [Candidatus Competibacter sp.]
MHKLIKNNLTIADNYSNAGSRAVLGREEWRQQAGAGIGVFQMGVMAAGQYLYSQTRDASVA